MPVDNRTFITRIGLFYAAYYALGNLSPILKKVSIPNICKSGFLSGCVSDMRVSSVGTSQLTTHWNPSSSSGRLTVNIGHVTVKGKWRFKISWIFRDSGRFRLTFHNIHFSLSGYIRNSNKLVISGCSCRVGSAKLKLTGGGSWLYNRFTGRVERSITRQANTKFCKNSCNKLKWKSFKI
ncbi:hypothetical protein KUTeg_019304 [Tegillarca granosa]|uniref:Lipid-binding serum glycoprotein N-terminal domain-containing protein n=1 Tax=Tegillarca granosa TaxID=220873 RepID=A0ABQ9EI35_TEGGR|nr:hypothetical protein KUTeg_019304 [Tegillarca granosa]